MKVEVNVYVHDKEVQVVFDDSFTFIYDRMELEDAIIENHFKKFEEVISKDEDSSPYEVTYRVDLEHIKEHELYRIIQETL
jgi:hypothetical protein